MRFFTNFVVISLLFSFPLSAFSQFTVTDLSTTAMTPSALATALSSSSVQVTNVSIQGNPQQFGYFNGNTGTSLSSGVILSTGNVNDAALSNISTSTTTQYNTSGEPSLATLTAGSINDAAVLEIEFIPFGSNINLNYVFASEEYPEYVGGSFSDVFGLFIGSNGLLQNIALVPSTSSPVSINSINSLNNSFYYVSNTSNNNLTYDGYTTSLSANYTLIAGQTYTLKIAIADVGDWSFDSAILLEFGSFTATGNSINGINGIATSANNSNNVFEGCSDGNFDFTLQNTLTTDTTIHYSIGGTAQNGIDYQMITDSITIPAGQLTGTVDINIINDGITEPVETIELVYEYLPNQFDTLVIFINESITSFLPLLFTDTTVCQNETLFGGIQISTPVIPVGINYNWQSTTATCTFGCAVASMNTTASSTSIFTRSDNFGCSQIDTININVLPQPNPIVTCQAISHDSIIVNWTSNNSTFTNASININNTGFIPANDGITGHKIGGLSAGTTVNVQVQLFGGLCNSGVPNIGTSSCTTPICQFTDSLVTTNLSCFGNCDGTITALITSGTGNFTYMWSNSFQSTSTITGLCAGIHYVTITDASGCAIVDSVTIQEPTPIVVNISTTADSANTGNGTATATVTGGSAPYFYNWSGGSSTGLSQGNYTLTVTDINGCVNVDSFSITDFNCTLSGSETMISPTCFDATDGSIEYNVTNNNGSVSYLWSNGNTTNMINNLAAGNYDITVTDSLNCTFMDNFTLTAPDSLSIDLMIMNDSAALGIGNITYSITGGTMPYTLIWSSGSPNNLIQGNYNLTVLDANNCSKSLDFYVDDVVNTSNLMDRKNIKIYPNPANNFINIEMNLKDKQLTNLKLFSVEGKLILQQNQFDFNGNTVKVLTDNLSEGLYFLQLTIDNQEVNQKILVLH